ncbi:hypothetical protein ABEY61_26960 [Bacillus toyonensis]|uniref:hypothetical protein n=1 Tax=Bacillus toyonensis TaxID=155322 RepID=UPI003D221D66
MKSKIIKSIALILAIGTSFVINNPTTITITYGEQTTIEMNIDKNDSLPITNTNDWRIIFVNRNHTTPKEKYIQLINITKNANQDSSVSFHF